MSDNQFYLVSRSDATYVKVAREIAIDHFTIDEILKKYSIDEETWAEMRESPRFAQLLKDEIEAWQSATNTQERTKLKAAAMLEDWLVEAHAKLHDKNEALNSKTELAKLITRIAGIGVNGMGIEGGGGDKFSVTINLGADQSLRFEKNVTPKVIDGEVT